MATVAVAKPKQKAWIRELKTLPWPAVIIIVVLVFVALAAPLLTPWNPFEVNLPNRLLPPMWQAGGSAAHIIGTDTLGRDLLTRIFYGARISLIVALSCSIMSGGIGYVVGVTAGYLGGAYGAVMMRIVDSILAVPTILLAIVFAMTLGPSMNTVILAITSTMWVRFARLIRGDTLSVAKRDFVLQAKVAGCSPVRIMMVHIVPNVFNIFMVMVSLQLGTVILMEASLSFLGAGIPPPTPSWGQMISEGRGYITSAWWICFFPGFALALLVFAFNMAGDWLRDRLDPKLRQL
jgi:peptide/nickel transport system permease protein